jgi:hypothetical protein
MSGWSSHGNYLSSHPVLIFAPKRAECFQEMRKQKCRCCCGLSQKVTFPLGILWWKGQVTTHAPSFLPSYFSLFRSLTVYGRSSDKFVHPLARSHFRLKIKSLPSTRDFKAMSYKCPAAAPPYRIPLVRYWKPS